jgi:hypothetical protein
VAAGFGVGDFVDVEDAGFGELADRAEVATGREVDANPVADFRGAAKEGTDLAVAGAAGGAGSVGAEAAGDVDVVGRFGRFFFGFFLFDRRRRRRGGCRRRSDARRRRGARAGKVLAGDAVVVGVEAVGVAG